MFSKWLKFLRLEENVKKNWTAEQWTKYTGVFIQRIYRGTVNLGGFPVGSDSKKNLSAVQEMWVQSLGWKDPLEKRMTTHSSILTWRIPWLEESGGLQSMAWGHKELDMTEQLTPLLLLLSCFSCVRLCATPQTAAHQAPPSLGFSRQEHWSGLLFPSPMHESEK